MVLLEQPVWLILIIPLTATWIMWRLPFRFIRVLRAVIFVLLILALCRPFIRIKDRAGTAVILADRSASMPGATDSAEKEIVDMAQSSIRGNNRLAVVSFGRQAAVEHSPQSGKFSGFVADVGSDQSDLASALESALSLIGSEGKGRLLVISDGRWSGRDPAAIASKLAARGIPVDYRLFQRSAVNDMFISAIHAPEIVLPGQAYMLDAIIYAPVAQDMHYEVKRGTETISSGTKNVSSGTSRLVFRDRAPKSGVCQYSITIARTVGKDPLPENNTARVLVGIRANRPILVTSPSGPDSSLANVLENSEMDIKVQEASRCSWTLADISQYSAIILENTFADDIGPRGMENLATWVEHAGGGLMITGGRNSYGTGGYFKSPLENIMPISMELRREHRKLSLAIVVALDRSGSMALPAGGGKRKIDLANIGTVQVLDLLSSSDEFGAVAVDSSAHVIVPLDSVEKNRVFRDKIMRIDSLGGGIFIYEALSTATKMLLAARASARHIILFADAADSEEPGQYRDLLDKALKANITVSVVGLGTPADCDAELLRDIAQQGGGNCTFTRDAAQIPRLFAQDTFAVSRSSFVEESTPFKLGVGMKQLTHDSFGEPPPVGGYNLCYARPGANVAAVTIDEYKAPIVASWYAGNGRVLCLTAETDGKYTGAFGQWPEVSRFLVSLAGWAAARSATVPDDMLITQNVKNGLYTLELHLDPQRERDSFLGTPRAKIIHGETGAKPVVESREFKWNSADNLSIDLLMSGTETLLATVEIPGSQAITLAPVCLPYSAEFKPDRTGKGQAALVQIAAITGGKERLDVARIWKELPASSRYVDLAPLLILIALFCFLAEVFERRTGLLVMRRSQATMFQRPIEIVANIVSHVRRKPPPPLIRPAGAGGIEPQPKHDGAEDKRRAKPQAAPDTISAMREARKKAHKRMNE